jgi:hypothetical protein
MNLKTKLMMYLMLGYGINEPNFFIHQKMKTRVQELVQKTKLKKRRAKNKQAKLSRKINRRKVCG